MYHLVTTYLRARMGESERGASLVEYALLLALIALVCFSAVMFFGNSVSNGYKPIGSSLAN
jgi:pilus assembly protein Flp/PilA